AVILAAPHHNSPVTLSGRRLFSGYEGTTHSHGLPYLARKSLMESPEDIRQCAITPELAAGRARVCPGYLLWSIHEQNYWKLQHPGGAGIFTSFPGEELYRIWKPE
ncbi:MAG TPA: hypothetical protein PLP17_04630, partial [Oligoflexia bacterium]|nr:hypothetical protein [Oligoflexia bacterium]